MTPLPEATPGPARSVFVVDDDADVRIALEALLQSVGFSVITFASAEEFLQTVAPLRRGCLVLDVRLTGQSGISLQADLTRMGLDFPIVFISGHGDIPMAVRAIKAGAVEFLTKPIKPQDLIDAIHSALLRDDERSARRAAADEARCLFDSLTLRERDVLTLVVAGRGNKETANLLGISEPTVKAHRGQIMRKMNAQNLPDLVRLAQEIDLTRRP